MSVTLCSSALEQATEKIYTVLEMGQIAHEDPTIKKSRFSITGIRNVLYVSKRTHIDLRHLE